MEIVQHPAAVRSYDAAGGFEIPVIRFIRLQHVVPQLLHPGEGFLPVRSPFVYIIFQDDSPKGLILFSACI